MLLWRIVAKIDSTHAALDPTPLGFTYDQWVAHCLEMGGTVAAAQADYKSCFAGGCLPATLVGRIEVRKAAESDGTTKFLIQLPDGVETESVILPLTGKSGRLRHTLCVSSQVGCAMGCTFCETAQMGLVRQLTPSEIVLQWHVARHHLGQKITNIVFMGMGEPLDNLESVISSIRVLTDQRGPSLPPSRIAVSTVGRIDGIQRLSNFVSEPGFGRLRLAVSVNAGDDVTRSSIMPLNRAMNMQALRHALETWSQEHRPPILIEYVLIPGVNSDQASATALAHWVDDLPCRINLIPYNPRRNSPWPAPKSEEIDVFLRILQESGLRANKRITLGRSLMAACGQLGNEAVRRRRQPVLVPR